jgi:type I restriction enzyme S subunit
MVRFKYLTAEPLAYGANEAALEDNPNFPRFIRITDIKEDGSLRSETFKSLLPQVAEPYLLQEGDILFARSGATVGKTFIYRKEWGKACFAGYLIRFRCNCDSLIPDFLFFFTQSNIYWTQVHKGTIQATIQKFSAEKYSEVLIPLPSLSEQRAIANYLDHQNSKINTLISAKERLLDLLTEKRQSLITHVITHGLNPNIPMLDCGIDWIGKIPKHWNLVQLKRITQKIGSGKTPKGGSEIYLTKGIPLIRSRNVLFSGLVISELVYIAEDIDVEMSSSRVQPYDVLINITGASIGRCCVVPECISQGNVNQHVCIIRPNFGTIKSEYLNAVLASNVGQTQVFMNQEGISREGLTFQDIGNFWIPLPPQDEQEKLIQSIQKYSCQLSKLYSVTKNTIKLLQERRTALITAAVIGQIKVTA